MLERGERPKAKYNYEKILGKALLGHGRAEHWAHSEYAWIAFEDGDLEVSRRAHPAVTPCFAFFRQLSRDALVHCHSLWPGSPQLRHHHVAIFSHNSLRRSVLSGLQVDKLEAPPGVGLDSQCAVCCAQQLSRCGQA